MPSTIPSPSIMAQSQINLMDLFGKIYNITQSYHFEKMQPAIWQCSDESQGIKKALLGYVFDCPVFNLGQVGAIVDPDRLLPASHHGKDIVIIGGSHIGTEVIDGIGHIDRINGHKAPCCGMLYRLLLTYLNLYKRAQTLIKIIRKDNEYHIEIPYRYLHQHDVTQGPELKIILDTIIDGEAIADSVQGKVFKMAPTFTNENAEELSHLPEGSSQIQTLLKKNTFIFEESLTENINDNIEVALKHSLLPYMSGIVTCKYPHRRIADLNTWREFHKITSHLTDSFLGTNRNIFLVAGLTADYTIKKNMYIPQFGFHINRNNPNEVNYYNPVEINELLRNVPVYTPEKSFLEYAEVHTAFQP